MSVYRKLVRDRDGNVVKTKWRTATRDLNGKRIFREFDKREEAIAFDRDAARIAHMKARADREGRALDDVIDHAVETGEYARRAPLDRTLDKLEPKRSKAIAPFSINTFKHAPPGATGVLP